MIAYRAKRFANYKILFSLFFIHLALHSPFIQAQEKTDNTFLSNERSKISANIKKFSSWLSSSPQKQIEMEAKDDEKGMGRLFIPTMTNVKWEKSIQIFRMENGQLIRIQNEKKIGQSVFLSPGRYLVEIGNEADKKSRVRKEIRIREGRTTLIDPDWSSLVIRFIDPARKYLRVHYEIFSMENHSTVGVNISKDENLLDEYPDTWILKPGMYKIVRAGYPYESVTNFATFRLLPGELLQYTVVADEFSGDFLGSGVLEEIGRRSDYISNFNYYSVLSSGINYINNNLDSANTFKSNLNLSLKSDNRFIYDDRRHFYLGEVYYEVVLSKENTQQSRIYIDDLEIKNLYIYYFWGSLGFYGRINGATNFFDHVSYFDEATDITLQDANGNTTATLSQVESLQRNPAFSPVSLREGMGLTYTLFRRTNYQIGIGSGLGFRQYRYKDFYEQDQNDETVYRLIESQQLYGSELSLRGNFQFFNRLTWSFNLDLLFPFTESKKMDYEFENVINFRIWKYINIEHTFSYIKEFARSYGRIENSLWLRISYIF